jgi:molybdate/tungstate transport system ATP-binding protein
MTASVAVEALALTFGAFHLNSIDFALSGGEILVILGPNGSGKSVTLETIAGFHRPDSGRVLIGGRDVTALPPERRNVGFVVQNFGLFPHLNVERNVAIAQRADRVVTAGDTAFPPQGDTAALLSYFGVAHLARRVPQDLSPGEKQRVALARALAGAPDLFLFDEPFSALDAETHDALREELKLFLRALALPAIFVTHDRNDALALADKIVVLRSGAVMQSGLAMEVFQKPGNSFVARFTGIENVLSGRIIATSGHIASIVVGGQTLQGGARADVPIGSSVYVCIRAEDVAICLLQGEQAQRPSINRLEGRITDLRSAGALVTLGIDCGFPLRAYQLAPQVRGLKLAVGMTIAVEIAQSTLHLVTE